MRVISLVILLGVLAPARLLAACGCPPEAGSKDVLITTAPGTAGGFVACGYEESRTKRTVRASEFEVFRCDDRTRVLEFSALETADLNDLGGDLHVMRVSKWPFGRHWKWVFVPVQETTLTSSRARTVWKPRLPKPLVTRAEVRRFVRSYAATVRRDGTSYVPDEETLARLFTAMVSGDAQATRLFASMGRDVSIDGATAEIYEIAKYEYALGRPR